MSVLCFCSPVLGRFWRRLTLGAAVIALSGLAAQGAAIGVDSTQLPILIDGSQFDAAPFSSSINGTSGTFSGSWISPGPDTSGSGVIYFVDGSNTVRDILNVTFSDSSGTAQISGSYQSYLTSFGGVPAGFTGIGQSSTPIDVTSLFEDSTTGAPVSLPGFISVSVATETPEPPVAALGGIGLAMVGAVALRKRVSGLA